MTYYWSIAGASRRLVVAVALILWSGCFLLQPLQRRSIGDLGYFEFRNSPPHLKRAVIGVPRAGTEPTAIAYADAIRDHIDAGLVAACYDFEIKRIPVSQPLIHTSPISWSAAQAVSRGSVYSEFRSLLRSTVDGPMEFYVGVRAAHGTSYSRRIEVASAGFTFEQLKSLKESYAQIRDQQIRDQTTSSRNLPRVEISLNPLDDISWNSDGVKNHGVLLLAQRGLILRMPSELAEARVRAVYQKILAAG